MIPKQLKYKEEARQKVKKGLDTLAEAVKVTLGPKGRNVVYENKFLPPTVTKDGVTVARQIDLEDKAENIGCQMAKEAAARTVDTVGDGTTTAVVLMQNVFNEGLKALSSGINPIMVKRGMDKAVEEIEDYLSDIAIPITGKSKDICNVATISSNNDEALGKLITDAIEKVGEEGVITIEESTTDKTYMTVVEGMQLGEGLQSPYFITETNKMRATYKKPKILVVPKEIHDPQDIIPIFQKCIEARVPLCIIAESIQGQALSTLIMNKHKQGIPVMAVKAPGYGEARHQMMDDVAIYTGTMSVAEETGMDISKLEIEDLGSCDRIEADKETCTIIKGHGNPKSIRARIEEIKTEMELAESDYDQQKLQERLAKLTTGVALLKIGGATETEMREKKMRVEDALHATKAAIDEGIVPGGGVALYRLKDMMRKNDLEGMSNEEIIGYQIVIKSLDSPLKTIAENAGIDGAEVIANIKKKAFSHGLNVLTMQYGDLIKQGVIDPVKVTRMAIKNAVSVAGLALTTECLITEKIVDEKDYAPERRA